MTDLGIAGLMSAALFALIAGPIIYAEVMNPPENTDAKKPDEVKP